MPDDKKSDDAAPDDKKTAQEGDDENARQEKPERRAGGDAAADQDGRVSAAAAAQAGLRNLRELTGKRPEGVTAVERTEDGWRVGVEVLEDQRVPSSADILAIYEADLDPQGELLSYRRTRRYPRGRADDRGDY